MDWLQVLALGIPLIGSLWYMHRENINDRKAYASEMKEFHGRMCTLEERYMQMMHQFWQRKE